MTIRLFLLLLCIPVSVFSQQASQRIQQILERYLELTPDEADYAGIQLQLEQWLEHPLDLNRASAEELSRLFFLSPVEVSGILQHRAQFGKLLCKEELQTIDALRDDHLQTLLLFIRVEESEVPANPKQDWKTAHGKLVIGYQQTLETQAGYEPERKANGQAYYVGPPGKQVIRYSGQSGRFIQFGFQAERDPGEAIKPVPDFHAAYLFFKPATRYLESIVVGDYLVSFGCGLTLGKGYQPGKSAYVLNVISPDDFLKPYRSVNEQGYFTGLATALRSGRWHATCFVSQQKSDGSPASDNTFTSEQTTGLHRTPAELLNRRKLSTSLCGVHLSFEHKLLKLGLTGMHRLFNGSFAERTQLYQRDQTPGGLTLAGVDFRFTCYRVLINGELCRDRANRFSSVISGILALDQRLDLCLLYRSYSTAHPGTLSSVFSAYADTRNEQGLYLGLSYRHSRKINLNAYADFFHSPWLRYRINAPSQGTDLFVEAQYMPDKTNLFAIRLRRESKSLNQPDGTLYLLRPLEQTWIRCSYDYPVNKWWKGCAQVDRVLSLDAAGALQPGNSFSQEFRFTSRSGKTGFTGRFGYFAAGNSEAGIYNREPQMAYQYGSFRYRHEGIRLVALVHFKLTRNMQCWLRWAHTHYADVRESGSGLEQINGPYRNDAGIQFQFTY